MAGGWERFKNTLWNNSYAGQFAGADNSAGRMDALFGGIGTGLGGLTGIASTTLQSARINDTPEFDRQVADLYNIGTASYYNPQQLADEYARMSFVPNQSLEQIRGMNGWQKAGAIGSSTLQGALTGASVGGIWGAVAGAGVGLLSGVGGVVAGDINARNKYNFNNISAELATNAAQANTGAASETLRRQQARERELNSNAKGGKIERRQLDIQEFANLVLKRKTGSPSLVHQKCKGGTMVRIKM